MKETKLALCAILVKFNEHFTESLENLSIERVRQRIINRDNCNLISFLQFYKSRILPTPG